MVRTRHPDYLAWARGQQATTGPLEEWVTYCNQKEAADLAAGRPDTKARGLCGEAFSCPTHGQKLKGPITVRYGHPHNLGRQFFKCHLTGCGIGESGFFRWADGTAPFSAASCRRAEAHHGIDAGSVGVGYVDTSGLPVGRGVGPLFGMVADHLDHKGKAEGPFFPAKRQKLGAETCHEAEEEDELDSDDSDDEFLRRERYEQAMRCECMGCNDPHPDPEQLITDEPSTPGADLPSSRDSNSWRVASDDWSRGICPDCSSEVQGPWGPSTSSSEDEDDDEKEGSDEDDNDEDDTDDDNDDDDDDDDSGGSGEDN